ncbi:MAG: amidohydrolase family protein, partial [Clostridiales bacterium]|nr:amidohydrolase family protein [Clostridiales bacterium]
MNYVLKNVNILPMTSEIVMENMSVVISDGLIHQITDSNEVYFDDYQIIDCKNKFLIPGLIDAHVHLYENEGHELKLFLANGITTVRNMWGNMSLFNSNPSFDVLNLKRKIQNKELLGPRIINTSRLLNDEPLHQAGSIVLSNVSDVENVVKGIVNDGYDFIKIYDNLKLEVFDEIMKVAKKYNIKVVGHRPTEVSLDRFLNSDIHSIEHTFYFDYDSVDNVVKSKKYVVPTLVTEWYFDRLMNAENQDFYDKEMLKFANKNNKDGFWFAFMPLFKQIRDDQNSMFYQFKYENEKKKIEKLVQLGGELVAGTDYANAFTYAGFSLHNELELLKDCGASNYQVLKAATINAAKCLELDEIGTIETGKHADLVLLNSNPLDEIINTRDIEMVIANGQIFEKEKLEELMDEVVRAYEKLPNTLTEAAENRLEEKTHSNSKLDKYVGVYKNVLLKLTLVVENDELVGKAMGQKI